MESVSILTLLVEHFGWVALVVAIILLLVFWTFVHVVAAPGKQVSYLHGLVSYTKRHQRSRLRRFKPINIIEPATGTLWRLLTPVDYWIDSDLSTFTKEYVDSLLDGPHHEFCKTDLSYFHTSYTYGEWHVRATCPSCKTRLWPEEEDERMGNRVNLKRYVVGRLKQIHLQNRKIKHGMRLN